MNDENLKLKSKIEEETKEDIDETLPSSEPVEEEAQLESETEEAIPELNSEPQPTEEQIEEASAIPEGDEVASEDAEPQGEELIEATVSESVEPQPDVLTPEQEAVEKMLSQSQVNEIVGRTRTETRDGTLRAMFDRYGVSGERELDDMAGRSQKYDLLRDDYDKVLKEISELKGRLAMYDSGIAPERYDDAKFILAGKGLELTPENILSEMETHPEWKKVLPNPENSLNEVEQTFKKAEAVPQRPVSTISVLGNDATNEQSGSSTERESALNLFH